MTGVLAPRAATGQEFFPAARRAAPRTETERPRRSRWQAGGS